MPSVPGTGRSLRPIWAAILALILALSLYPVAAGASAPPDGTAAAAGDAAARPVPSSLLYTLLHVSDDGGERPVLVVTNPTPQTVRLTFPTAQRVDFSFRREGAEWWRTSWGESYAQVVTVDTLGPYRSRLYAASIPDWLPAGRYQVVAHLLAGGERRQVARAVIVLGDPQPGGDTLRFALTHRRYSWEQTGRLGLSISNPGPRPVRLTYPAGWSVRVEVRDSSGSVVWQRVTPATTRQETFAAGAARYHVFPLPALAPGRYTARAWFAPAGERPVASISFTVR